MTDQPVKAFRCTIPDLDLGGIVFARTAKRAKQRFHRIYRDFGCSFDEIKTRRTPEYDSGRPPCDVRDPSCWDESHIRKRMSDFDSRYDLTDDPMDEAKMAQLRREDSE